MSALVGGSAGEREGVNPLSLSIEQLNSLKGNVEDELKELQSQVCNYMQSSLDCCCSCHSFRGNN